MRLSRIPILALPLLAVSACIDLPTDAENALRPRQESTSISPNDYADIFAPGNLVSSDSRVYGTFPDDLLLVRFVDGTTAGQRAAAADSVAAEIIASDFYGSGSRGIYYLRLDEYADADTLFAARDRLNGLSQVEWADPDLSLGVGEAFVLPSDGTDWEVSDWTPDRAAATGQNWALEYIRAPLAWGCSVGSADVKMAVVDTWFQEITDLQNNLGNDTIGSWIGLDSARGHGSLVASILTAEGGNDTGMAGVMWHSTTNLYNFFAYQRNVANALYATVLASPDVVNLSIAVGWLTTPSSSDSTHVEAAAIHERRFSTAASDLVAGVANMPLVVAAAGNTGVDASWNAWTRLAIPRVIDRVDWAGTSDLVVAGIAASLKEIYEEQGPALASYQAFRTNGESFRQRLDGRLDNPLLMVRPVPQNDTSRRTTQSRLSVPAGLGTVSTFDLEGGWVEPMDFEDPGCQPGDPPDCGSGGSGGSVGVVLADDYADCTNVSGGGDTDLDGILQSCEAAIAGAFAPQLRFHGSESASTRYPHYSVRKSITNSVGILYMLAYQEDTGQPGSGVTSHLGDSEWLYLTVTNDAGSRWVLTDMTYSAHWNTGWDRTDWYVPYGSVTYVQNYRGTPISYAAWGKHANYKSYNACWASGSDTCGSNPQSHGFSSGRNVGNSWGVQLINCAYGPAPVSYTECFFTDDIFRGWMAEDGPGSDGGYKAVFQALGF